jgi:hypothetical protein
VVQCGHHLNVNPALDGQNEVASAESWVAPAINEAAAKLHAEALNGVNQIVVAHGVREVIQTHIRMLLHDVRPPTRGVPFCGFRPEGNIYANRETPTKS